MIRLKWHTLVPLVFFTFSGYIGVAQYQTKDLLTHKVIVNYDDSTIVAYVKPVRGVPVDEKRQYYWFSSNKVNHTQGGYSGKLLNGNYSVSYANKNLKELGNFHKGLKTGVWKNWNEDGKLKMEYSWFLGQKNGPYYKYDSLGRKVETGKYRNDLLSGKQSTISGDSTKIAYYRKGNPIIRKSIMPGFIRRIFK